MAQVPTEARAYDLARHARAVGAPDRRRRRRQARARREVEQSQFLALLPLWRLCSFIALRALPDAVARSRRLEAAV